jgi:hypothetical protein
MGEVKEVTVKFEGLHVSCNVYCPEDGIDMGDDFYFLDDVIEAEIRSPDGSATELPSDTLLRLYEDQEWYSHIEQLAVEEARH